MEQISKNTYTSEHNNTQESTAGKYITFLLRWRKLLFWVFIVILAFAAYNLSKRIETRGENGASIFSFHNTYVVHLYEDIIKPNIVTAKVGDEIEFVVKDESRHNMFQMRGSNWSGDARIESGEFGIGESYLLQFNEPGEYHFYDRLNRELFVTINVK